MPSEPLSPDSDIKTSTDIVLSSQFRFRNICTTVCRLSPLPTFSWADSQEVWTQMIRKESQYHRDQRVFDRHPTLQPRMRSILLDWIIEVILYFKKYGWKIIYFVYNYLNFDTI